MAKIRGVCHYADCEKDATKLVYHRELELLIQLCDEHVLIVVERDAPEYVATCPNCNCVFGVN